MQHTALFLCIFLLPIPYIWFTVSLESRGAKTFNPAWLEGAALTKIAEQVQYKLSGLPACLSDTLAKVKSVEECK